jgi:hypothetical protein
MTRKGAWASIIAVLLITLGAYATAALLRFVGAPIAPPSEILLLISMMAVVFVSQLPGARHIPLRDGPKDHRRRLDFGLGLLGIFLCLRMPGPIDSFGQMLAGMALSFGIVVGIIVGPALFALRLPLKRRLYRRIWGRRVLLGITVTALLAINSAYFANGTPVQALWIFIIIGAASVNSMPMIPQKGRSLNGLPKLAVALCQIVSFTAFLTVALHVMSLGQIKIDLPMILGFGFAATVITAWFLRPKAA